MIFFTSDHHFNHRNIIKYCSRPFETVEEMNTQLIRNWNEKVTLKDTVYHLGDFTLGRNAEDYFSQLNGTIKILGIPWHHDKRWLAKLKTYYSKDGIPVEILMPMEVLKVEETNNIIVLSHYPIAEWERKHYGAYHVHGHSHSKYIYPSGTLALDVGIDNCNYYPISLSELILIFERIKSEAYKNEI